MNRFYDKTVTLTLATRGEAFGEPYDQDDEGIAAAEIASLLHEAAERIENGDDQGVLFDSNGARAGSWSIDGEDE